MKAPDWSPHETFVWTKAEVTAWKETHGVSAPHNGTEFRISTERIPHSAYWKVTFIPA